MRIIDLLRQAISGDGELSRRTRQNLIREHRENQLLGGSRQIKPIESQTYYFGERIQRPYYRNKAVIENLKVIRDLNPDASLAIWNFLRLANTNWLLQAVKGIDAKGAPIVDEVITPRLQEAFENIAQEYGGGLDVFIDIAHLTLLTQGAVATEVELTDNLKEVVDVHLVDPAIIDFRRDKETGKLIHCYRDVSGKLVDLNPNQFFYLPLDPEVGEVSGRSPILSALQTVFFQVELLKDLKAVVHNQGHPRIDVEVLEKVVMENAPAHLKIPGKEEELAAWISGQLISLQNAYDNLKPDDAFIHFDNVKINFISPGQGMDFGKIDNILSTQICSALKQLPLFLGRNIGVTETHGTVQYKIFVHGIESLQKRVEKLIERCGDVFLRAWGSQGYVDFEFERIITEDKYREAQAELIGNKARQIAVWMGWISNDEAAQEGYGHDAVGEPQIPPPLPGKLAQRSEVIWDTKDFVSPIRAKWATAVGDIMAGLTKEMRELLDTQLFEYVRRVFASPPPKRFKKKIRATAEEKKLLDWLRKYVFFDARVQEIRIESTLEPFTEEALRKAGQATLMELHIDKTFEMSPEVRAWQANRLHFTSKAIQDTTQKLVARSLLEGFKKGESVPHLAERIRDLVDVDRYRSTMIARTEVLAASNRATIFGYKQSGVVVGKRWVATHDERTCDECIDLDEEYVKLDADFPGGYMEPPIHPNCRCTTTPILDTDPEAAELYEGG